MSQNSYIWAVGYHDDGSPSICGPYLDQSEAVEKTDHLSRVQFTRLATRDRSAAIPQLSDRIRGTQTRQREPSPIAGRSRIINRILRRRPKTEDDNADNADNTA